MKETRLGEKCRGEATALYVDEDFVRPSRVDGVASNLRQPRAWLGPVHNQTFLLIRNCSCALKRDGHPNLPKNAIMGALSRRWSSLMVPLLLPPAYLMTIERRGGVARSWGGVWSRETPNRTPGVFQVRPRTACDRKMTQVARERRQKASVMWLSVLRSMRQMR